MISGVAFCPMAPVLVPEAGRDVGRELDEVRAACRSAMVRLAALGDPIAVLGPGERTARFGPTSRGTLRGFGVPLDVTLGSDAPDRGCDELPLSLTVAAWLLRDALGPDCGAHGWSVPPDVESTLDPVRWPDADVALLVMGDGSACRSRQAPGYFDERAVDFDDRVTAALGDGDASALASLDPATGVALLASGVPVWRAVGRLAQDRVWHAEQLYAGAPFGVAYFVAVWTPSG